MVGTVALSVLLLACPPPRDVIPESHDVQGTAPTTVTGGYEYVAKRPLAVIAVAESRGLPRDVVAGVADRLASSLDACATQLASQGRLVPAAARVAAHVDRDGAPTALALTLTPGPGPTANALLCFVSPFKQVRFPAGDIDPATRGIAIEAAWGSDATTGTMAPAPKPEAAP